MDEMREKSKIESENNELRERNERIIRTIASVKEIVNSFEPWSTTESEMNNRKLYLGLSSVAEELLKLILKEELLVRLNKVNSVVDEVISILSWEGLDNYNSALGFDQETKTILIDEDRLMRAIQLINPAQFRRDIKIVKGLKDISFKELIQEQQLKEISNGSKTINQARKEYGLEPLEGGDTLTTKL